MADRHLPGNRSQIIVKIVHLIAPNPVFHTMSCTKEDSQFLRLESLKPSFLSYPTPNPSANWVKYTFTVKFSHIAPASLVWPMVNIAGGGDLWECMALS